MVRIIDVVLASFVSMSLPPLVLGTRVPRSFLTNGSSGDDAVPSQHLHGGFVRAMLESSSQAPRTVIHYELTDLSAGHGRLPASGQTCMMLGSPREGSQACDTLSAVDVAS